MSNLFFPIIQVENKLELFPHYGNQNWFCSMPHTIHFTINWYNIYSKGLNRPCSQPKNSTWFYLIMTCLGHEFQIFVVFYVSFRFTDTFEEISTNIYICIYIILFSLPKIYILFYLGNAYTFWFIYLFLEKKRRNLKPTKIYKIIIGIPWCLIIIFLDHCLWTPRIIVTYAAGSSLLWN